MKWSSEGCARPLTLRQGHERCCRTESAASYGTYMARCPFLAIDVNQYMQFRGQMSATRHDTS